MNLILASSSPRRVRLLESLGLKFATVKPSAEESDDGRMPPDQLVNLNSRAKAESVAARSPSDALILGADTLVYLNGKVLGKPLDLDEAREMLLALSGKQHTVYTGITLIHMESGSVLTDFERTEVTFRRLTTSDVELYLQSVRPLDRAGAYTVEGAGSLLVERFEGCYYNVLGLPLVKLDEMLRKFGANLFKLSSKNSADR